MITFYDFGLATVSTSYANTGGTGDRTGIITISSNLTWTGTVSTIINGAFTNSLYWANNALSGIDVLAFDFGSAKVIDEFKWYQSDATTHGTWVFEGSSDGSSWTGLGSSFTLTNGTFPITNTTAYRYYRLRGLSGTARNIPWLREIEFKISA